MSCFPCFQSGNKKKHGSRKEAAVATSGSVKDRGLTKKSGELLLPPFRSMHNPIDVSFSDVLYILP